jgi:hypothetical protein
VVCAPSRGRCGARLFIVEVATKAQRGNLSLNLIYTVHFFSRVADFRRPSHHSSSFAGRTTLIMSISNTIFSCGRMPRSALPCSPYLDRVQAQAHGIEMRTIATIHCCDQDYANDSDENYVR